MSLSSSKENSITTCLSELKCDSIEKKDIKLEKIVKDFVSSICQIELDKIKNKILQEKQIFSRYKYSSTKKEVNQIKIENFINSIFDEVKRQIICQENKCENISYGHISHMNYSVFSEKKQINKRTPNLIKTNGKYNKNSCLKCKDNISPKNKKVHFAIRKNSCDSNMCTFSKDKTHVKTFSCMSNNTSLKNQRNCSTKEKDKKNKKIDLHKSELSFEYKAKRRSDKEKKQFEEKLNIMKRHISVMKRRQKEMDKKISFLKLKEINQNNIKKEKDLLKKVLAYNSEKKESELIKKRQNIEKQKEAENNRIKRTLGMTKMEKIMNYKQIKEENKELNDKAKMKIKHRDYNAKNIIEKIRILREYNKNIAPERKRILSKKNKIINTLACENNFQKTNLIKQEITKLEKEEKEYMDKLNTTKIKLNNIDTNSRQLQF